MEFHQIGVLGSGNIGIGVVTDLLLHGISAVVVDISQDILQRAQAEVLENVRSRCHGSREMRPCNACS